MSLSIVYSTHVLTEVTSAQFQNRPNNCKQQTLKTMKRLEVSSTTCHVGPGYLPATTMQRTYTAALVADVSSSSSSSCMASLHQQPNNNIRTSSKSQRAPSERGRQRPPFYYRGSGKLCLLIYGYQTSGKRRTCPPF